MGAFVQLMMMCCYVKTQRKKISPNPKLVVVILFLLHPCKMSALFFFVEVVDLITKTSKQSKGGDVKQRIDRTKIYTFMSLSSALFITIL